MTPPMIVEHDGIIVVRDDMILGGTKSRYFEGLFEHHDHVVYASPCEGGAQTALAAAAQAAGKRCTIFVAKRANPHPRSLAAKRLGATVVQVEHGYLNVVQSKAAIFCERTGAFNLPFGGALVTAHDDIAEAARSLDVSPDEVWCAGGSGTLACGLLKAWPGVPLHVVQVGRDLSGSALGEHRDVFIHPHRLKFAQASKAPCPFPSDPHYDRKAWEMCRSRFNPSENLEVLFWNVTGPAEDIK